MTDEQTTTRRKSDIRASQVVATALAAVTAAFLGSRLGVAGTISGAGLASMISTCAGALYQRSLDRTTRTVKTVRSKVSQVRNGQVGDPAEPDEAPSDTAVVTTTSGVLSVSGSLGDPTAPSALRTAVRTLDARPPDALPRWGDPNAPTVFLRPVGKPTAPPSDPPRRRLNWRMATAVTALAFLIGMAAVTGFELLHHGPISGGDSGTTVGSLFGQSTERPTTGAPTTGPSGHQQTADPSTTGQAPTTTPSTITPSPTTTPTTTTGQSQTQATTTTSPPATTTTAPTTTDVAP
jgi:hypothetical protein